METKKKVNSLGLLRGLAVILVCFCHFGNPLITDTVLGHVFKAFEHYGKYGVQIFFVISGFIIPLSMDKAGYDLKYYLKFLGKRAMRLHPPYLVALLITFAIVAAANYVKHIPFPENAVSIIKSLFYAHAPSDNPVFWTLKIEAQYYIFMGLYFVLLKRYTRLTLLISLPLLMVVSQIPVITNFIWLFNSLVFFLIGTVGYLIYNNSSSKNTVEYLCLATLVVFTFCYYDVAAALASLFTIGVILFYHKTVYKVFDLAGEISYSVYLIHYPIGVKFINLTIKHVSPNYYWALFIVTNVVVLLIAVLFWKIIEKPFGDLSNKIKYGKAKSAPKPLPVIAV